MCAKNYENPTMLSGVTAKNVGDVFFETHCIFCDISRNIIVRTKTTVYKRTSTSRVCLLHLAQRAVAARRGGRGTSAWAALCRGGGIGGPKIWNSEICPLLDQPKFHYITLMTHTPT